MLPKTLKTYDQIVEILAGFPELSERDFEKMDLSDTETVRDVIKYLYMTLGGVHTAMSQLRFAAELEMRDYIITLFRKQAVN